MLPNTALKILSTYKTISYEITTAYLIMIDYSIDSPTNTLLQAHN
jgi:hypothetical protein